MLFVLLHDRNTRGIILKVDKRTAVIAELLRTSVVSPKSIGAVKTNRCTIVEELHKFGKSEGEVSLDFAQQALWQVRA